LHILRLSRSYGIALHFNILVLAVSRLLKLGLRDKKTFQSLGLALWLLPLAFTSLRVECSSDITDKNVPVKTFGNSESIISQKFKYVYKRISNSFRDAWHALSNLSGGHTVLYEYGVPGGISPRGVAAPTRLLLAPREFDYPSSLHAAIDGRRHNYIDIRVRPV